MNRRKDWTVSVTHIPSGITVTRGSNHYRNQHLAKEAAVKYLKSKLAYVYKGIAQEDIKYSYLFPDEEDMNISIPRDAREYRREVE